MHSQGEELALQHDHGLLAYQDYVGAVAQHVAVDTEAAASAIAASQRIWICVSEWLRQAQTVQQRFDWPVVARLHHQLYAELAERRRAGQQCSGLEGQHPLRGDPFRDFAPFATACLGPDTELRLAMPFPELQQRLNNSPAWIAAMGELHASPKDLQRLLVQLHDEGAQTCTLTRLLSAWP